MELKRMVLHESGNREVGEVGNVTQMHDVHHPLIVKERVALPMNRDRHMHGTYIRASQDLFPFLSNRITSTACYEY